MAALRISDFEPYGRKAMFVQQDLRYGDFGTHLMIQIEPSNFLMIA
jgi:hypothetical protein